MAYIRDLVTYDQQAEFRNDVQLSHYDNPNTNIGLVQSFIFSTNAPRGKVSAVDLLEKMKSMFTLARQENRMVCIANYGHGKSHLALVLANYFAKPYGSPELEKVLEKVVKAVNNSSKVQMLREFRQDHGEFLVIRLRGDENIGLREQFMSQAQIALKEHAATKNERIVFWSEKAMEILDRLTPEQKVQAETFLETLDTDLAGLRGDVRNHRDQGYDRTRTLYKQLHGVLPDLGGEVDLKKLILQIANNYCGQGKPLAGIVVLFDEFSLFIQRYAQRPSTGELMSLLNGIEELGSKAIFLAFSQHDPITVAKNSAKSPEQEASLQHELSRIPDSNKVFLYSLMESVIDSYLKQPEQAWGEFKQSALVRGPIARASNAALDIFSKHYIDELRWTTEKFDEVVTRGAFPLHPLTTALLCNLTFAGAETIGNPRTILGFIRKQVTEMQGEPAIKDGQINWVLPIFLVDYFEEYLGKEYFGQYKNALKKLPDDAPPEQQRILKALLLQMAAELKFKRDTQENFLEEAAGVPHGDIKKHLAALVSAQCIRKDESNQTYSFWALSTDPDALIKWLTKKIEGQEFSWEMLSTLTKEQVKTIPVSVKWGHSDDWEAKEVLMTRRFFTVDRLKQLFPRFQMSVQGILEEGVRGGVVWLVPESTDDVLWFQQNATQILDDAFPGDHPLPIILKTTDHFYPGCLTVYQKLLALRAMPEPDRKNFGSDAYEYQKQQLEKQIQKAMYDLRGEENNYTTIPHKKEHYIVPAVYRGHIRLTLRPDIKQVLEECYQYAYSFSPPEFFQTYRLAGKGTTNLWKAVRLLSTLLMRNRIGLETTALQSDHIAQDTIQKFLFPKWKILREDSLIQEPTSASISQAWDLFENTFKPGTHNLYLRDTIIKLLNPPYGYDYNTLTLLLSAWIGYHQHDLQFTVQATQIGIEGLAKILNDASGRVFFGEICGTSKVSITRRDAGEVVREVNQLIERVYKEIFTRAVAEQILAQLNAHYKDAGLPQETLNATGQAIERLQLGIDAADKYDQAAGAIQTEIENGTVLQEYIQIKKRITELPQPGIVLPTKQTITELDNSWRERLATKIEKECNRLVKVTRLQDVGVNRLQLETLQRQLKSAKLETQAIRVQEALGEIDRQEKELSARETEAPIYAEIQAMNRLMPLQILQGYADRLQKLSGYSKLTLELRDQRYSEICNEIQQLMQVASGLISGVTTLDTMQAVQEWNNRYQRTVDRFEGTSIHTELAEAYEKVKQIQNFLGDLAKLEQRHAVNLEGINETIQLLEALKEKSRAWLTEKLDQRLAQDLQKALDFRKKKSTEAHSWLIRVQSMFRQNVPLHQVIRELNIEQPFLLPVDRVELEQLRKEINRKKEEDVVSRIEVEFRGIVDPVLRQACLSRLQAILVETQETSPVD